MGRLGTLWRIGIGTLREKRPTPACFAVESGDRRWFLHVSLKDQRGRRLAATGKTQRHLSVLWSECARLLKPDLVVDVGANYGEFGLGERFPEARRIILFEANPALVERLQRSRDGYPDRAAVEIVEGIATAPSQSGKEVELFVHPRWSGVSSASRGAAGPEARPLKCRAHTVDEVLGTFEPRLRMLFKIDVEGYEGSVVEGMRRSLEDCDECVGLIEFNRAELAKAGTDVDEFLRWFAERGSLYLVRRRAGGASALEGALEVVGATNAIPDGKEDLLYARGSCVSRLEEMKWVARRGVDSGGKAG